MEMDGDLAPGDDTATIGLPLSSGNGGGDLIKSNETFPLLDDALDVVLFVSDD